MNISYLINIRKIWLLLFLVLIIPFDILADTDLDSLFTNIQHLNNKEKLHRYLQIEEHFYQNRDSLTIRYYKKARELSQKIGDDYSFFKSKEILADYYFRIALYSKTIKLMIPVIRYKRFNKFNNIYDNYVKIIDSYYRIDFDKKALEYYYESKIFIKPSDQELESRVEFIVGDIYLRKKLFNKAKKSFLKSLTLNKNLKNRVQVAKSYDKLAKIFSIQRNYHKAIFYQKKSLEMYKKLINKHDIGASELKLARYYLDSNRISLSEKHIIACQKLFTKTNNNSDLANLYEITGELYFLKKDFGKSEIFIQKSLNILENLINNDLKIKNLIILSKIKLYNNESIKADSLMEKTYSLIKSNNKTKINMKIKAESRKLSLFQQSQKLEKVQKEINLSETKLNRVKILIIFVTILILIIILFAILSIKRIKLSKKLFSELTKKTADLESKKALNEKYSEEKIHLETKNIALKMVFDANDEFNIPLKNITENLAKIKSSKFCPDEKLKKRLAKIESSTLRIKQILEEMTSLKNVETEKYIDSHNDNMISFKSQRNNVEE